MITSDMGFTQRGAIVLKLVCLFVLFAVLVPASAHAYIDPGTGSFLLQGILAVIVGAGVMVKVFWVKILSLFGKTSTDEDDDVDEQ